MCLKTSVYASCSDKISCEIIPCDDVRAGNECMNTTMVSEFTSEECSLCKAEKEKKKAAEEDKKIGDDEEIRRIKAMEEGRKEVEENWKIAMWFNAACRL